MREWHVKHIEKIIVKYVTGLASDASAWEKRNNKKYGRISNIRRQLDYDIKHGATKEEALYIIDNLRNDDSFLTIRTNDKAMERLNEMQEHFVLPRILKYW